MATGFSFGQPRPVAQTPADVLTFGIPQANETGQVDNYDVPRWLYNLAPQATGKLGFGNDLFAGRNMTLRPGAVGDSTYKVGDTIYSGSHTGGFDSGDNTSVARAFDPNSVVSYANSPQYQQALKTGQWSLLNGTPYNIHDANGNVIGTKKFEGLEDSDNLDEIMMAVTGAAIGGMGLAAAGGGAGAGGAGTGAAGGGATGATGAAGVTGFGDAGAMYGGLDAAGAASLGGGASVGGGAALGTGAAGAAAGGVGGASSAGGTGLMDLIKTGASKFLGGTGGAGMSWTDFIGPALNLIGGAMQNDAAGDATDAMVGASREGIAENRRQFDLVRKLLNPYVNAGTGALDSYQALSGALGPQKQAEAIQALQGSPQFTSLVKQGEDAILQNASATGGLRGGNTQDALAEFRSNVLSSLIDKQLGRMGGLAEMGQNSATGVGNASLSTGARNAQLLGQIGASQAGGIVAGSNAITNALGGVGGFFAGRNAATPQPVAQVAPASNFGSGVVYPEYATTFGGGF